MKRYFSLAIAVAIIGLTGRAMAAEVDMSKLTCKEVATMSAAKTIGIAMWMNGYVHGKAGNTMLDGDMAEANAVKVAAYCKQNPDATLASAIEAVSETK
jgi:acid stress chaperone HdeB